MINLSNLSHADFEDLCVDLATREYKARFEAFGPGADQGFDGRCAVGDLSIVLQSKHYVESKFSDLIKSIKVEKEKNAFRQCRKYLLFTSFSLTPKNKEEIVSLLDHKDKESADVWGREDIESALRRNDDILKGHIKLWLSSPNMLDRIVNSGVVNYSDTVQEELRDELKLYVRNKSYDEALKKLDEENVLIISGAPGVGKTTLAKMLSYSYICNGWKFKAITSIDQGFSCDHGSDKEIIYFDDFLGSIELDRASLIKNDNAFSVFLRSIHRSRKKKFILTTRAHIFEEARGISDRINSKDVQIGKYILDTGKYTRSVRARILYNHLSMSEVVGDTHIINLLSGEFLPKIIDHKNYNPRVVSHVSDKFSEAGSAREYGQYILESLDNPDAIWRYPYESLPFHKQVLLIAVYFMPQYGADLPRLRCVYNCLIQVLCKHYNHQIGLFSFEKSLRDLESGFLVISQKQVKFVNPAVRDFLKSYLIDFHFLEVVATGAIYTDWAKNLWRHGLEILSKSQDDVYCRSDWGSAFIFFSKNIKSKKARKFSLDFHVDRDDLYTGRIELLLDWWDASKNDDFLNIAISIVNEINLEDLSEDDAENFPEIFWRLQEAMSFDSPCRTLILSRVNSYIIHVVSNTDSIECLSKVISNVDEFYWDDNHLKMMEALRDVALCAIRKVDSIVDSLDYSSEVEDIIYHLNEIRETLDVCVDSAVSICSARLEMLECIERNEGSFEGPRSERSGLDSGDISNEGIISLFQTLVDM